jgi:hypothetical protein
LARAAARHAARLYGTHDSEELAPTTLITGATHKRIVEMEKNTIMDDAKRKTLRLCDVSYLFEKKLLTNYT